MEVGARFDTLDDRLSMRIGIQAEIRKATPDDVSAVAAVLKQAFAEYEPLYTKQGYAVTTAEESTIIMRMCEGPMWVAVHKERTIGTIAAVCRQNGFYVRGMAVLPTLRGLGIGRLLLEKVEAVGREYGCKRLFLSTTPFLHRAIRLYEDLGFTTVNEGPHDLFGTPLFTMEKVLSP